MKRNRLRKAAESGDSKAALDLAEALVDEHEEEAAVEILRACFAAGGKGVALTLADILGVSGDEEYEKEAEVWYQAAVDEGISGAVNDYGSFLSMFDNRSEEAERLLLRAADSGDELAYGNLGKLYLDEEQYDKALPWLRKSLAAGNTAILPFLAQAEIELGEGEAAWTHVQAAMDNGADDASLTYAHYLVKFGDRHPELSAEAMFLDAVNADDQAHFDFANWLKAEGRLAEAESHYRVAIEHGETNAHLNLAHLLDDLERPQEAQTELRAGAEAGDPWAAAALARSLADAGRRDDVPAAIRQAEQLGCPQEDITELWTTYHSLL